MSSPPLPAASADARSTRARASVPAWLRGLWAQHWFLCLLPVAFALAWAAPELAAKGGWARPEITTKLGVMLIFLLQGLQLPTSQIRVALGQARLHAVVQGMTFLGFPLIGLALAWLVGRWLPDELRVGLVYLSVLPSTVSSAAVLTATAGGNIAGAICNAVLSSLLGVVLTPLLLAVSMGAQDFAIGDAAGGGVDAGRIVWQLVQLIVLPLCLGQLLRLRVGEWAARHKRRIGTVNTALILFVVFAAFCDASKAEVWTRHGATLPLEALGIAIVLFALATWLTRGLVRAAGLGADDAIAAEFCAVQKTLASGVPLAGVIFAGDPRTGLILLPLLIYHPLQRAIHGAMAARRARGGGHAARTG